MSCPELIRPDGCKSAVAMGAWKDVYDTLQRVAAELLDSCQGSRDNECARTKMSFETGRRWLLTFAQQRSPTDLHPLICPAKQLFQQAIKKYLEGANGGALFSEAEDRIRTWHTNHNTGQGTSETENNSKRANEELERLRHYIQDLSNQVNTGIKKTTCFQAFAETVFQEADSVRR